MIYFFIDTLFQGVIIVGKQAQDIDVTQIHPNPKVKAMPKANETQETLPQYLICEEDVIRLIEVRYELPYKPSIATVRTWARRGILETVKIGGQTFTSKQAVRRFLVNQEIAQRRMKGGL